MGDAHHHLATHGLADALVRHADILLEVTDEVLLGQLVLPTVRYIHGEVLPGLLRQILQYEALVTAEEACLPQAHVQLSHVAGTVAAVALPELSDTAEVIHPAHYLQLLDKVCVPEPDGRA